MSRVVATPSRRAIVAVVAFIVAFCQSGAFSALTPSDSIRGGRMIAMSRAERLVDDAVDYLEELPSLSAELNFETRLFGKRYYGHGRYEELTVLRDSADSSLRPPLERTRFLLTATMTAEDASDQVEDPGLQSIRKRDEALWDTEGWND